MLSICGIYEVMRAAKLAPTQRIFSIEWLGKTSSYLSATKAMGREPSIGALTTLAVRLGDFNRHLAKSTAGTDRLQQTRQALALAEQQVWQEIQRRSLREFHTH